MERNGLRYGFLQRSSVYWPTNHEAGANSTGIAVIRAHTAYQVPMHKTRPEMPPLNRPGIPPVIITWADPDYLRAFTDDIAGLRASADIVVASCHWGLHKDVLAYMREIGHAAIDAGADIVIGHGPHYSLPVEVYRGKPIFYGLGSFSFHTGHGGRAHGDWIGMMVRLSCTARMMERVSFRFVRHNARNETVPCRLSEEAAELDVIRLRSAGYGTAFISQDDEVVIDSVAAYNERGPATGRPPELRARSVSATVLGWWVKIHVGQAKAAGWRLLRLRHRSPDIAGWRTFVGKHIAACAVWDRRLACIGLRGVSCRRTWIHRKSGTGGQHQHRCASNQTILHNEGSCLSSPPSRWRIVLLIPP